MTDVFEPAAGGAGSSVLITLGAASVAVAVPAVTAGGTIRLANSGSTVIFVRFGTSTAVAVVTDMAMLPNTVETFKVKDKLSTGGTLYVAAIAGGAGNTLYITPGEGA